MLSKATVIQKILAKSLWSAPLSSAQQFAPTNIALAKYWGKRNAELNLPMNSSLSISLDGKGALANLTLTSSQHHIRINQQDIDPCSNHGQQLSEYLTLFQGPHQLKYQLDLTVNIPLAAGLASSACIFAAIIKALNQLHHWQLSPKALSILARLGSGSAARSIEHGFVEWHMGNRSDGLDSYAEKIPTCWHALMIGLCIFDHAPKSVSSRHGMQHTMATSPLYAAWPTYANQAVTTIKHAIATQDFTALGSLAENNALTMHATMQSAWPALRYTTAESIQHIKKIWQLRDAGLAVYFTQDAGPNLKLLCLKPDIHAITSHFPQLEWIQPFNHNEATRNAAN